MARNIENNQSIVVVLERVSFRFLSAFQVVEQRWI
jgi:hypothetical protein